MKTVYFFIKTQNAVISCLGLVPIQCFLCLRTKDGVPGTNRLNRDIMQINSWWLMWCIQITLDVMWYIGWLMVVRLISIRIIYLLTLFVRFNPILNECCNTNFAFSAPRIGYSNYRSNSWWLGRHCLLPDHANVWLQLLHQISRYQMRLTQAQLHIQHLCLAYYHWDWSNLQ